MQLGLAPMVQVIHRRRVTARDGATAAVLTSWFPAALGDIAPDPFAKRHLPTMLTGYQPTWGRAGSRRGHQRQPRHVSSGSSAAHLWWLCTDVGSPPTTPSSSTPS